MSETKGVPNKQEIGSKITPRLLISTLKLFNAFPVTEANKAKQSNKLAGLTIDHGFIFSPTVIGNYKEKELISVIDSVAEEIGLSPAQMNSSFHKSWKKVRDAPMFQLLVEQVFHYMTTYGYEALGVYDENSVFIPNEQLDIPELKEGIKLSIVKGYTTRQLKSKLLFMLESGIALSNIDDIVEVSKFCGIDKEDISKIKNKEVRIRLYKNFDIIPEEPIEFLRLVLLETGNELLIINKSTIKKIKESKTTVYMLEHFQRYDDEFGYKRLAEIFQRFKPLFLAFKRDGSNINRMINRISMLSKKYHRPLRPSLLNNITGVLKSGGKIKISELKLELDHVNIFRKIRLLNSLNYRLHGDTNEKSIVYKIRNGKSYATTFTIDRLDNINALKRVEELVLKSILHDLSHLKGKKVYIPNNIKYGLPATVKQFTGNIPSGSYVVIPKDLIFGVNWSNVNGNRIDLDLSVISINNGKLGWNGRFRSDNILFSGDMTDAPHGASELFYVNKDFEDTLMMYVNYYNHDEKITVPFKIVVAEEHPNAFGQNYTINPNNVKCIAKTNISTKQKILGLIRITHGECIFYFSETSIGDSIVSSNRKYDDLTRDYLIKYMTGIVTLNSVLQSAGVKLVEEKTKDSIDLSPESIEKDSFIKLLTKT